MLWLGTPASCKSPLVPRLSGQAATEYVKATAAGTKGIELVQHIVEGNYVATLSVNELACLPHDSEVCA